MRKCYNLELNNKARTKITRVKCFLFLECNYHPSIIFHQTPAIIINFASVVIGMVLPLGYSIVEGRLSYNEDWDETAELQSESEEESSDF